MIALSPVPSTGTLRERFIADMTVRGYTAKTQHDYLRTVSGFAAFRGRSPSTARLRTSAAIRSSNPSAA